MRYTSSILVLGDTNTVLQRFGDLPAMAALMPGASLEAQRPDGGFPGSFTVRFGPKRLTFKGVVRNELDYLSRRGTLVGQGVADMRAAKIAVKVTYTVAPAPDAEGKRTVVELVSEAELHGVLAEFAKTGGVHLANAILDEFANRFSLAAEISENAVGETLLPESQDLSGFKILWRSFLSMFGLRAKR
jgi:carbon monoxide dehydrogenase subunit G